MLRRNSKRSPTTKISAARRAAFEILRRVEESGGYSSFLLAASAEELQANDRALTHELVMGVLRRQLWLDYLTAHYGNRKVTSLDAPVRIALRLGLYQLRFMSRIPASAAVNESVSLVRFAGLSSAAAFVNAVLRRATREADFDPLTEISDPVERLAVESSHPPWLIQRWIDNWGWSEAAAFACANNEVPPTAFRSSGTQDTVPDSLKGLITASSIAPGAWRSDGNNASIYELARQGRIYIQDEASQLVAHALQPGSEDLILDVCAAPGGKTTHLASLSGPSSMVVAGDLHQHRLRSMRSMSPAESLINIHLVTLDGTRRLPFREQIFDRVLVDAPCTGTGTLRRNPEIRWRLSPADIEDLAGKQLGILTNAASAVKPGGRLVYSTCSVEPEENEQVVAKFMNEAGDFRPAKLDVNPELLTSSNTARTWPHRHGADGFFIAAFQRA
ncbi:MAG TPA: 16S rRNA (cytosine(967)-C(5))-methyltransferase RsmB [Pyrinomonadaceae bacterium]|nr:16S rRNA (cytosine(967)-C(5))-methyltransferase RsmB [Pyrinomonadaceae bacterium]